MNQSYKLWKENPGNCEKQTLIPQIGRNKPHLWRKKHPTWSKKFPTFVDDLIFPLKLHDLFQVPLEVPPSFSFSSFLLFLFCYFLFCFRFSLFGVLVLQSPTNRQKGRNLIDFYGAKKERENLIDFCCERRRGTKEGWWVCRGKYKGHE